MPGLTSLSKSLISRLGERRSQCAILELDDSDKPVGNEYLAFQYFPETITDSKQINYQPKEIPGGSLPLYQWISSGERVLSFSAVFSCDVDLISDPVAYEKLVEKGESRRNVDIRVAILWLRRFMLPRYGKAEQLGVPLTKAPRKLLLRVQNSGIGLSGGSAERPPSISSAGTDIGLDIDSTSILHDTMTAIMTQCDVTYEAFFPSGLPRLASVSLSFAQIAQVGGMVTFPSATAGLDDIVKSGKPGRGPFFPYGVKVKFK